MVYSDLMVSDLYFEEFKKDCEKNERRTTLAYFGVDIIIDKEGDIHCIEINGQNAGTSGLKEAYGCQDFAREKLIKYLASFGLPLKIYTYFCNHDDDRWAEEQFDVLVRDIDEVTLECSKKAMGNQTMSDDEYFNRQQMLAGKELYEFEARFLENWDEEMDAVEDKQHNPENHYNISEFEKIVWNNSDTDIKFDTNKVLVVNPQGIEWVTKYKMAAFLMYNDMLYCLPLKSFDMDSLTEKDFNMVLRKTKTSKVVFKPEDGKCGNGVVILDKKKIITSAGKPQNDLEKMIEEPEKYFDDSLLIENIEQLKKEEKIVMQPFVESKPFYNPKTGKHHRGSVRYALAVHSHNGMIDIITLGAYVRLASNPVDDTTTDSYVANLSSGAYAIPIPPKDFNRIKRWVDNTFKDFYRMALRIGEIGHIDPIKGPLTVQNYSLLDMPEQKLKEAWRWQAPY